MRITENNVNRYINLLSSGSASGNNALKVSISDETFRAEREKAWQNEPLTVSGSSYIPNITYNTADTGESIEKVSIVNGIFSDVDKTHEYLKILRDDRDDMDYSGMGGGEIINSIMDRYKKYFDYDGDLSHLQHDYDMSLTYDTFNSWSGPEKEKRKIWENVYDQLSNEIRDKFNEYNVDQKQAWIEYYGYGGMTDEERMQAIVNKYSDGGFTYNEAYMLNDEMNRTGCIDNKTCCSIFSDLSQHRAKDFWYGALNKYTTVNFSSLLSDSYKELEQSYFGLGMSEKDIEFVKERARLRIPVYEEILNILRKEEI